jgi:DNA-binding IclR family transcriptional regulator
MQPAEHRTTNRILDILEVVSQASQGLTLSEIGRRVGAPKSSIFPLLGTLAERRYLSFNEKENRYFFGESLFVLGNKYVNDTELIDRIRAVLLGISKKTNETLYLGILSGREVLYLARADLYSKFRVMCNPGTKAPAYSTGFGKALLSQFTSEQICGLYPEGTLEPVTENTVRTVEELNRQLDAVRRTGFATENGESTEGIRCVAVPVKKAGKITAGISIAVPEFRYTSKREQQFKDLLLSARSEIEDLIANHENQWNYN